MSIESELGHELREAMKTGDGRRRDVVRQIRSEVQVAAAGVGFSGEIDDDLYRSVIAAYSKKMAKSRDEYRELGGRGAEMAEKLDFEIGFLSRWLPTKLGEDETARLVDATISELGVAGDPKATGRVIGTMMKAHDGDLDGALVNRIVRERLS